MRKAFIAATSLALVGALAVPAAAHVTVQPNEAIAGGFQTFFIQVPNERDDESTVKVEVEFPPVFASVSFADVEGWERDVKMVEFDEPVEAFGEEITEGVGSVTFSGGEVEPGEFIRFPFSVGPVPEGELEFKALQTYDSGEVVRWIGPADSEEPAARVNAIDLGLEEGEGQLATLAELREQSGGAPAEGADTDDEEENFFTEPEVLIALGALLLALVALLTSMRRGRPQTG